MAHVSDVKPHIGDAPSRQPAHGESRPRADSGGGRASAIVAPIPVDTGLFASDAGGERSAERAARTAGAPPGSRPGLDENGEIANRLVPACPSELDRDVTSAIGSLGGVWCTGRPAAVAFLAARSALLAGRAGHPTLGSRRGCHAQRRDGRAKRTRGGVDDICPGSLLMQAMAQRTGGTVLASA